MCFLFRSLVSNLAFASANLRAVLLFFYYFFIIFFYLDKSGMVGLIQVVVGRDLHLDSLGTMTVEL